MELRPQTGGASTRRETGDQELLQICATFLPRWSRSNHGEERDGDAAAWGWRWWGWGFLACVL